MILYSHAIYSIESNQEGIDPFNQNILSKLTTYTSDLEFSDPESQYSEMQLYQSDLNHDHYSYSKSATQYYKNF